MRREGWRVHAPSRVPHPAGAPSCCETAPLTHWAPPTLTAVRSSQHARGSQPRQDAGPVSVRCRRGGEGHHTLHAPGRPRASPRAPGEETPHPLPLVVQVRVCLLALYKGHPTSWQCMLIGFIFPPHAVQERCGAQDAVRCERRAGRPPTSPNERLLPRCRQDSTKRRLTGQCRAPVAERQ